MKVGVAGSVESNDILITVVESNELVIEITSIVDAFFHDQIEKVIKDTLEQLNIKNVKVTLKIKGKTYTAKTNSNGKAIFKITKLTKKGKYTATVRYAGSKYYNAKSVKVKITVK